MYHTLLHPAFSSGQSNSVLCTDTKSVIRLYTLSEHTTCHRVSLSVHILANLTSQCVYFASLRPGSTIRFQLLLRRCKYRQTCNSPPVHPVWGAAQWLWTCWAPVANRTRWARERPVPGPPWAADHAPCRASPWTPRHPLKWSLAGSQAKHGETRESDALSDFRLHI